MKFLPKTRLAAIVYLVFTVLFQALLIFGGIYSLQKVDVALTILCAILGGGIITSVFLIPNIAKMLPNTLRLFCFIIFPLTIVLSILCCMALYPVYFIANCICLIRKRYPIGETQRIKNVLFRLSILLFVTLIFVFLFGALNNDRFIEDADLTVVHNKIYPNSQIFSVYSLPTDRALVIGCTESGAMMCNIFSCTPDGLWSFTEKCKVIHFDRAYNNSFNVFLFTDKNKSFSVIIVDKIAMPEEESIKQAEILPSDSIGSVFEQVTIPYVVGKRYIYYAVSEYLNDEYTIVAW